MAPIIPDPKKIKSFRREAAFATWLAANHARETELWLKIHKKGSGLPTVAYAQALDVALCWGWIDGLRKAFDECSFLQRFPPRKARSVWSQINREHVAADCGGRRTLQGQSTATARGGRWKALRPHSAPRATSPTTFAPPSRRTHGRAELALGAKTSSRWVERQQHEDAGRPRQEDRDAGGDAGAR